jgi:cytochrome c oxidase subunit 2
VPDFGMKKDAIPGFVNEMWFRADTVGVYRGQCAELCGRDHAFMPVVVDVRSKEDFQKWLQSRQEGAPAEAGTQATQGEAAATAAQAE